MTALLRRWVCSWQCLVCGQVYSENDSHCPYCP
jgi:rubrerythrin